MNVAALKARLKIIAKEKNKTFNQVWKQLLLERFLARIALSNYHDKFIFKGGLLLASYLFIGRETTDIDFSIRNLNKKIEFITIVMQELCDIQIDDGMNFHLATIDEIKQPHMEYHGLRISLHANFDNMKDRLQIDMAFGDYVTPETFTLESLKYCEEPIFSGEITLRVYPLENILAEKLEAIVSLGGANSRMKDYHDVILIFRNKNILNRPNISKTIETVFQTRGTELVFPIEFDQSAVHELQLLWSAHLRGLGGIKDILNLPAHFADVLNEINSAITCLDSQAIIQ